MTNKQLSLLLGGFVPAVLFGIVAVFQKVINRSGTGMGPYLMGLGLTIFAMGALFALWDRDFAVTPRAATFIALFGVLWSVAMVCVAIAIKRYDGQIGQLVSIYNMNTLVTVVIGLVVLSEWKNVQPGKLLAAAVLITLGGILAANA
jgi:drug/metabolite transporter (DMT)-like permease